MKERFDMELSIEEMQTYGNEMLKTVADICEKNHLRWYMAYGSALGAIRHQGPIPWDSDIDIYVPECDLTHFLEIMEKNLPSKFWIDYRNNSEHPRAFPRIGLCGYETEVLHIDVYRLGGLPQDLRKLKRFTDYSRFLFVTWKSKTIDINYYYPDKKRRMVSKTVKALTALIPIKMVMKLIDKQAGRIPFDEAKIVASPLTTRNPKRMLKRELFDDPILVKYADFLVRVPRDYNQYLEANFVGDWRVFPPIEYREQQMRKTYTVRVINK